MHGPVKKVVVEFEAAAGIRIRVRSGSRESCLTASDNMLAVGCEMDTIRHLEG